LYKILVAIRRTVTSCSITRNFARMTSQALATLTGVVEKFLAGKRRLPVASDAIQAQVQRFVQDHFKLDRPNHLSDLVYATSQMFERWEEHSNSPRHFGLFRPGSNLSCVVADALVALYNPNLARASFSPPGVEIERYVLQHLGSHIGFGQSGEAAHFTSGGAEANQTAVLAALYSRFPKAVEEGIGAAAAGARLYVSSQGHHSLDKAAVSSGLGRAALVRIPIDHRYRMRVDALSEQIRLDLEAGLSPFMVTATAGTTATGAIDPIEEMAAVCAKYGIWLHVDAAWAGTAALSARQRPWLTGIEKADSVTWDAHKWLSVATGAGMFFCKHPSALTKVFSVDPAYVAVNSDPLSADPLASSLQWSRRVIGLKVLLLLAEHGSARIAERIDYQVAMGNKLREGLRSRGWQIHGDSPLPLVCFSHPSLRNDASSHDAIVDELRRRDIAWTTRVLLPVDQQALRACITNIDTNEEDVDALVSGASELIQISALAETFREKAPPHPSAPVPASASEA
jgi:glutamate/tyrosine decarboxylase-like PLP-dependent enzyme